jgi:hypothetical protein
MNQTKSWRKVPIESRRLRASLALVHRRRLFLRVFVADVLNLAHFPASKPTRKAARAKQVIYVWPASTFSTLRAMLYAAADARTFGLLLCAVLRNVRGSVKARISVVQLGTIRNARRCLMRFENAECGRQHRCRT